MDSEAVEKLQRAGLKLDQPEMLRVPVQRDENKKVMTLRGEVPVMGNEGLVLATLKPISQLWTGSAVPPDLSRTPPPQYQPFFLLLESTAANYCAATGRPETDDEFERLYRQLRRRPDGDDTHPLFSYLQGAARLYMSLRDVSQAEFEAVANRLSQSAKWHSSHVGSTNYYREVLQGLFGA
ncbi:hypothetical protein [Vitiosangium sp. GDMCC 1.1324]|uniref:hypothetical protein n=1 Tax=Vitiosangium sp. (strain GDMCC 1.1324) TaxID=2138576 RepID=UPI000D3B0833|nr:hypothetical protein [Vitiosangium sp. GDMCC 1.1324]PTL83801.1 hypothetical protein DAT35_10035 [Vitiosangium sp. GDMCC 1.1324]